MTSSVTAGPGGNAIPQRSSSVSDHLTSANADDDNYVSPAILAAVEILVTAAETETARLTAYEAADALELVRDRLLKLQNAYGKAALTANQPAISAP